MRNVALVLGGADTLHSDYADASSLVAGQVGTIVATNNAGRDFDGDLPHWCTLHTEKMGAWIDQRKALGRPAASQFWTSNTPRTIPKDEYHLYKFVTSWDGSSGLLAITVALELGYSKIILCGVPLDKKAKHYDDDEVWMDAPRYRAAWVRNLRSMSGKVKSFSGWTKQILGEPTEEWLQKSIES